MSAERWRKDPRKGLELRRRLLLAGLLLGGLAVVVRAGQLQLAEGGRWERRAEEQQSDRLDLPAPRGVVYDRDGTPLAASREVFRIAVAPREVEDRLQVSIRLRDVLGLTEREANRALDPARRWVVLSGRYDAAARVRLAGVRGIHFERVSQRFYPHGELALELVGRTSGDGRALGGLELVLDSLLSGRPGVAVVRRDARGQPIPGPMLVVEEPVPGSDVHLTIDAELQEIAQEALLHALRETRASGGDFLIADPRTGEILAAVSRRAAGSRTWMGVAEPYEPGSTIKPFLVATLLAERKVALDDSVYAEQGRWVKEGRRPLTDSHAYEWLTVREALSVSSNIAMAKLAERLHPRTQFAYLRDFGFGVPTGVPYTSESSGMLRRPARWSAYSQRSLAIGYELAVTPLQMTMAYAALANGGLLLEPRLIRQIRSREGRVLQRFEPRTVRRAVPAEVARAVAEVLVDVVETGTGKEAAVASFTVAGKTGTARRVENGRYGRGHTASFAGFFPAEDPQLVFLAKLDDPKGAYYGGLAAAPITRTTLAAALAARGTPLDRGAVAAASIRTVAAVAPPAAAGAVPPGGASADEAALPLAGPYISNLDSGPPRRHRSREAAPPRPVPDVAGLAIRDAAGRLHAAGFRVEVEGSGTVAATAPAPGVVASPRSVVRIRGSEAGR